MTYDCLLHQVRLPFGALFAGFVGACGGATSALGYSLMGDVVDAEFEVVEDDKKKNS